MFGLINLNGSEKFVLKSVKVDSEIKNLIAKCGALLVYKNETNQDKEALLMFPLEDIYMLNHVEAHINGRVVLGRCQELSEAKKVLSSDAGTEQSDLVIQYDRCSFKLLTFRVGIIPRNSEIRITLNFAMELTLISTNVEGVDVDRFCLQLPWILKPYQRSKVDSGEVYQVTNPYDYSFDAIITGTKEIKNIFASNYRLKWAFTGDRNNSAKAVLDIKYDGIQELDLNIDYLKMNNPSVLFEHGTLSKGAPEKGDFFRPDVAIINFTPEFGPKKMELIFVIDRSDSMSGSTMQRAKECLLLFIKSIPTNSMFQIYGFGSYYDKAFIKPLLYGDESLKGAMEYHKKVAADYDLTDFMLPLKNMYSYPVTDGYTRVVFLLTDGDVANKDEVIQLIRQNTKDTSLNCIGIGNMVSDEFIDRMAKEGLGQSVLVKSTPKLVSSFKELFDKTVTLNEFIVDKIEWHCPGNASVQTVPSKPEPVRQNTSLSIYCIVKDLKKEETIRGNIIAKYNGTPRQLPVEICGKDGLSDNSYTVHSLLAKYQIEEMRRQVVDGKLQLKNDLIKLSVEANMETEYTTMVAMDVCAPNKGHLISEKMDPLLYYRPIFEIDNYSVYNDGSTGTGEDSGSSLPIQVWMRDAEKKCTHGDIVIYIADKQNINGSWDYDEELIWRLGLESKIIDENQPDLINSELWITTIVFEFLATKLRAREKEWQLLGKKAKELISISIKESSIIDQIQGSNKYGGARNADQFIQYVTKKALFVLNEVGNNVGHITSAEIEMASSKDVAERKKYEIVFVIDRSASMKGVKIESSKQCLFIFLKSLPDNCKFQIYGFGSNFDKAFIQYEVYDDDSIQKGLAYQYKMDASFGDTDLMKPLQDLYSTPLTSNYSRLVFVLTDGQINNESQAVELVRQNNKTNRVFAIGIGKDVSTTLVKRLAEAGLGKAAFVEESSILSSIVMDLLDEALFME